MGTYVLGFQEIDRTQLLLVGGKGLHLGELAKMEGIQVPDGFCVTTAAFQKAIGQNEGLHALMDCLAVLTAEDRDRIGEVCTKIRQTIMEADIPSTVVEEVGRYLSRLGEKYAYAVRSSATAEDLPFTSFAGQQDSYLNVIGKEAILQHIGKCWTSLFTERAVIYRMRNGIDHRQVFISVVVQRMVFPNASGVMFTADPITSNRKLLSIDASFGLGEAIVSGLVSADCYKVREGKVVDKRIATKKCAVFDKKEGGTEKRQIETDKQGLQTLTEQQVMELARIGRVIEAHFGGPQDIEWCLADEVFYIVQSRPITTLFPIPENAGSEENHVYVSVGHQQMMTDPIKPLGLSFYLLTTPAPMRHAGGRLFVDVTQNLASPAGREVLLNTLGQSDPLIKDALMAILNRGDIIKVSGKDCSGRLAHTNGNPAMQSAGFQADAKNGAAIFADLMERSQASIDRANESIRAKSGAELFDFILEDIVQLQKHVLFEPKSMGVIMAAMDAAKWINEKMDEWLGETNAADTLSQSVQNNITSEMGLALLDVADQIRPYPEVVKYLKGVKDDSFLDGLVTIDGGQKAHGAISAYLKKYGMRCSGEIDITKSRWSEKPASLVPMILSNIKNFKPEAGKRKFDQGLKEALDKEKELLERLKQLPDGEKKAGMTKGKIQLLRTFMGYREYPKYGMVSRYFVYKQALLKEAERLVKANIIHETEDIFYLFFDELRDAVLKNKVDYQLIRERKVEYKVYEKLAPPRVLTSDGEIIAGAYKRENIPAAALAGLPVSSGVIEGRARVILKMEDADLEEGDILVTTFTDPSWTPLFVSVKGLVAEVGGLMTHGAVIAREYGLPAVIGVEDATKRIKDGQQIRVNGTEGYIEVL